MFSRLTRYARCPVGVQYVTRVTSTGVGPRHIGTRLMTRVSYKRTLVYVWIEQGNTTRTRKCLGMIGLDETNIRYTL